MVRIVEFVATWNGTIKKGSIVMRKEDGDAEILTQLGIQRFTMFLTMLQSSSEIQFDPESQTIETEVSYVD